MVALFHIKSINKKINSLFESFLNWRLHHIKDETFMLILSAIIGVLSGLTAWLLKTGVYYMHHFFKTKINPSTFNFSLLIYPFIGIGITVIFKNYLIKDHIKHDISTLLEAISRRKSIIKKHKSYSSILGAILTVGFGGSVGLESPIISSGASIGSNIGRICKLNYKSITTLLGCGATGAIAAIFNTPIAGILFALEVLMLDMNRFSLIPLLVASISGTITTELLFADAIVFEFHIFQKFYLKHFIHYLALGVIAGFTSYYFTKVYISINNYFRTIISIKKRFFIGASGLAILLFIFPAFYGEGFDILKTILSGNAAKIFSESIFANLINHYWVFLLFFFALIMLKVVATAFTNGAGGIGGIFAPSLFTGAILGFLLAQLNNHFFAELIPENNFALVGMASVLGGVLQAPLTGIFLIAEITSGYELFVPLMLSTTVAFITSKKLTPTSLITKQLAEKGALITHDKDKAVLHFMSVSELIETDLIPVDEHINLKELLKSIAKSRRNIFPVLNNENLIGIILLDDVREVMFDHNYYDMNISNFMKSPPDIIDINDSMHTVMEKFNNCEAWNLPVCNGDKYIGFISKSKLFSAYRNQLKDLTEE